MSLDLKLEHAKTDQITSAVTRDIGGRLFVLELIEAGMRLTVLLGVIWIVYAIVGHLLRPSTIAEAKLDAAAVAQPCGPATGRIILR